MTPRSVRSDVQVVASPTILILTTQEVSFIFLEYISSTGITYDNETCFKNINYSLNTSIYSYLEASGGQSFEH